MTVVHHTCEGFLRFVLPEDTVTVDMEVMTLKGIHIFQQDKNSNKKTFIPWSEHNKPPSSFLKRLRETQDKPAKDFLESLLDRNLEANFRPKICCKCPKIAKMSDGELIQDIKLRRIRQMAAQLKHRLDPQNPVEGPQFLQTGVMMMEKTTTRPPTEYIICHLCQSNFKKTQHLPRSINFWQRNIGTSSQWNYDYGLQMQNTLKPNFPSKRTSCSCCPSISWQSYLQWMCTDIWWTTRTSKTTSAIGQLDIH